MEKIVTSKSSGKGIFKKYQNRSISPLKRVAKFLKVPLFKGDLGGSTSVISHMKKFSNTL